MRIYYTYHGQQQVRDVDRKEILIGRLSPLSAPDIDLGDDPTVSRRHLRIGLRGGELFAEDVNSLNGTLLEGQALMPFQAVVLREGQTLTLGRAVLRVRRTGDRPRRQP